MASHDPEPPLTEPVIVQDTFVEGAEVDSVNGELRIVAWVNVPRSDAADAERRIVGRLVLTDGAARALLRDLRKVLSRGGQ
ncbi:hypothetical protein LB542_19870 [Mesorhizobium sp. BR1-1-9]|uniref:hypothetical protein n=1 Tax=Mesorhizobium sp. BR1-1-9 TaxID=2876646 RepID=UPI001CD04E0E|nr:hypothetical protein [Mesorhizobium sp. BR1-1-9]MBZ9873109.1 hypothetical protein [Mesorhizobium sp. BR1-1-9]